MKKRSLNVIKTTRREIAKQWGTCAWLLPLGELYIRCNSKTIINWDKAPVYTWDEIKQIMKVRPVHFLVPAEEFELP